MNLYRAELYKIWSRKATIISAVIIFVFLVLYFILLVNEEVTTIDGISYTGFEAVRKDRNITKEYQGTVTNQKIEEIVKRYGLPQVVEEEYGYFRDANYLNGYVTHWFSDGYLRDWDDYKLPEVISPIETSDLGLYLQELEKENLLFYTNGWSTLLEYCQMGFILLGVFMMLSISPIFAEEHQEKTVDIIFTTKYGKTRDIAAKVAASFSTAVGSFLFILILGIVLSKIVYGLEGSQVLAVEALHKLYHYANWFGMKSIEIGTFFLLYVVISLGAGCMLTAIILWISAKSKVPYFAVITIAVICLLPILFMFLGGSFFYFVSLTQPVFLVMYDLLFETAMIRNIQVAVIIIVTVGGTLLSSKKAVA